MDNDIYKFKVKELIKKSKEKGLIKTYSEFIETEEREDIFVAIKKLYETCILHEDYNQEAEKHAIVTLQEIWDIIDENRDLW